MNELCILFSTRMAKGDQQERRINIASLKVYSGEIFHWHESKKKIAIVNRMGTVFGRGRDS